MRPNTKIRPSVPRDWPYFSGSAPHSRKAVVLVYTGRPTRPPLVKPTMAEQRSLVTAPKSHRGASGSLRQNTSGKSHLNFRRTIARFLPRLKSRVSSSRKDL